MRISQGRSLEALEPEKPMTAEREAMTLEAVRDSIRYAYGDGGNVNFADLRRWADAIDAHLSRTAEPDYWAAIDEEGDVEMAYSTDDGSGGSIARTACNQWINDHGGAFHLRPLFAHPSEDWRDAARLDAIDKWTAAGRRVEFAKSLFGPGVEIGLHEPIRAFAKGSAREAIDAAMAQERSNG
jgi:hypothetical protein